MKRSGPSDHQEQWPLIWAPSQSLAYHDLEWQEPPSKEQWDVNSWWDLDRQFIGVVDCQSGSMKLISSRKYRKGEMDVACGHIGGRWGKELVQTSSFSEFLGSQLGVSRHLVTRMSNCQMLKCRNECKIPWSQSNGAGEFEYDRRANVSLHSVTARNHWWFLPEDSKRL